MPAKRDYWWRVGIDANVNELARQLREVWETYACPWLECNSKLANATEELEKQQIYFRAAAGHLLLGQNGRALRMAELGLKKSPRATAAHAWARKHGLLPHL